VLLVGHADDPAEMALGVDPTQGVLENVELTGIIGDDHRVGQQATGDDRPDHGRLGDPPATASRRTALRQRFDRIFTRVTGFAELDQAVARTHANKDELLLVLDRPEIPLHTNGSENAVRSFVTKRRISGETRSAAGKQARDTFLSLLKTCSKLAISFWDYLGARLKIPDADRVPWLPDLIRQNASA